MYTILSAALLFAFTKTPLGLLLNAVRDNAKRVAFMGYNAHRIRYITFIIAGFFAGIAGGVSAIHWEIITVESLSTARSGGYLLFTFLGGTGFFFGFFTEESVFSLSKDNLCCARGEFCPNTIFVAK